MPSDAPESGSDHPSLSEFDLSGVPRPAGGLLYLYRSANDGFWYVDNDPDIAQQEATGYPVGELVEHEERGEYEDAESGALLAINLPWSDDEEMMEELYPPVVLETIDAAAKTHVRHLEDICDEVDEFGLQHVEAIEEHPELDARDAGTFWESAEVETVAEAFRDYHRVEWGGRHA